MELLSWRARGFLMVRQERGFWSFQYKKTCYSTAWRSTQGWEDKEEREFYSLTGMQKDSAIYFKVAACLASRLVRAIMLPWRWLSNSLRTREAIESIIISFTPCLMMSSSITSSLFKWWKSQMKYFTYLWIGSRGHCNFLNFNNPLSCLTEHNLYLIQGLFGFK